MEIWDREMSGGHVKNKWWPRRNDPYRLHVPPYESSQKFSMAPLKRPPEITYGSV